MKRAGWILISATFLVVFLGVHLVFSEDLLVAKIDFAFKAAGTPLPAGKYTVRCQDEGDLVIQNMTTGKSIVCPYFTRLATREDGKGLLVFDKVGDQYYLSEIFTSTMDGFALKGAEGKHTHVKVPTTKS